MRWDNTKELREGDVRKVKKFAWLPTKLAEDVTVWLENYVVTEECVTCLVWDEYFGPNPGGLTWVATSRNILPTRGLTEGSTKTNIKTITQDINTTAPPPSPDKPIPPPTKLVIEGVLVK